VWYERSCQLGRTMPAAVSRRLSADSDDEEEADLRIGILAGDCADTSLRFCEFAMVRAQSCVKFALAVCACWFLIAAMTGLTGPQTMLLDWWKPSYQITPSSQPQPFVHSAHTGPVYVIPNKGASKGAASPGHIQVEATRDSVAASPPAVVPTELSLSALVQVATALGVTSTSVNAALDSAAPRAELSKMVAAAAADAQRIGKHGPRTGVADNDLRHSESAKVAFPQPTAEPAPTTMLHGAQALPAPVSSISAPLTAVQRTETTQDQHPISLSARTKTPAERRAEVAAVAARHWGIRPPPPPVARSPPPGPRMMLTQDGQSDIDEDLQVDATGCPRPTVSAEDLQRGPDLRKLAVRLGLPHTIIDRSRKVRMDLGGRGQVIADIMCNPDDVTTERLVRDEVRKDHYNLFGLSPQDMAGEALDIGSHGGTIAVMLAKLHPRIRRIHAFEPSPVNYFYLVWNIHLNGVADRVVPRHLGLSATNGRRSFRVSTLDSTGNRMSTNIGGTDNGAVWDERPAQMVHVHVMQLGAFLSACGVKSVPFVKLDCEGCEYEIVPPNTNFFVRGASHVAGELHKIPSAQPEFALARAQTHRIMCEERRKFWHRMDAFFGCS